jgi:hypothetical protein
MQHLDEGTIHAWLDGALSREEAARVEEHVKGCPQCEAGVAEARGFIAASSRILTALDNAPRGVIPAVAPKKRIDPLVWRVAATVMIVAAGTLVVVRSRGGNEAPMSAGSERTTLTSQRTPVAEGAASVAEPATIAGSGKRDAGSKNGQAGAERREVGGGNVELSKKAAPSPSRPNVAERDYAALPEVASQRADRREALPAAANAPGVAGAPAPARVAPIAALSPNRAVTDAAMDSQPLKIVGTPRRIGAKVTLYEVAPGDTVTLTESVSVSLQGRVLTGASAMTARAQGAGKATAAQTKTRNAAPTVAPADSQAERVLAAAPAPAAAVTAQLGAVSGFNTIVWSDPATGSTLTLTGRMPEARLKEIKIRIERERAAAAAAAKKSP